MTMLCADAGYQCSGETILRNDNGVALTRSGVQAYGRSTSDMGASNPNVSSATGLFITTGGSAEMRVRKDANAVPNGVAMLLSNLDIRWSGTVNRPQIIETFNPTAGRVQLNGAGALSFGSLPPASDLGYYDYASLGTAGTRANYANNRYFPRPDPPRCSPGGWCAPQETTGPVFGTGAWRSSGTDPDRINALRYHEDGDIHAGNGVPDGNGNPTWLPGGNGFGVPVPGSKGYRTLEHWSYRHANLASWFTQDTVNINEWGGVNEHNKNRRGFVAYGETTDPALVAGSGTVSYTGVVYGRYAANSSADPVVFSGTVSISVNFATRSVTVSIQNTPVPVALTSNTTLGTGGNANYMTGPAIDPALAGGLSARLFGPIAAGGSGTGPAEAGGVFSLSNSGTEKITEPRSDRDVAKSPVGALYCGVKSAVKDGSRSFHESASTRSAASGVHRNRRPNWKASGRAVRVTTVWPVNRADRADKVTVPDRNGKARPSGSIVSTDGSLLVRTTVPVSAAGLVTSTQVISPAAMGSRKEIASESRWGSRGAVVGRPQAGRVRASKTDVTILGRISGMPGLRWCGPS